MFWEYYLCCLAMGKPCHKLKKVARETQKGSMAFGPTHVDSRGRSQKIKKETMAGLRALSAPKVGSGDTCGDRYFAGIL